MAAKKKKRGKYANELERLRELNAINEVLKKGDIENAALTNTSKDSETVSDNVIDNMLDRLNLDKNSTRDLQIVERLSSHAGEVAPKPKGARKLAKRTPPKTAMKQKIKGTKRKKR